MSCGNGNFPPNFWAQRRRYGDLPMHGRTWNYFTSKWDKEMDLSYQLGFSDTFGSLKQPISLGSAPRTETDIFKAPKNRLFLTVYSRCPQFNQNPIAKLRKLSKKELHIALLHGNRMNPSTKRSPQIEIFGKCACLTQNKRPQKGEHAQGWKVWRVSTATTSILEHLICFFLHDGKEVTK